MHDLSADFFRKFLFYKKYNLISKDGSSEQWSNSTSKVPVFIEDSLPIIPAVIIKRNLKEMGCTEAEYYQWQMLQT